MISSSKRLSFPALAALVLVAAGCSYSGEGQIPCVDNSSCPSDYPVCGSAGKCVAGKSNTQVSVKIIGVAGKQPGEPVRGTATVQVSAQSVSGVRLLSLTGGAQTFAPAAGSAGPVYDIAVDTTKLAEGPVSLTATVTPGDPSVQPLPSAAFILTVDNTAPVITAPATLPPAQLGSLVNLDVTASESVQPLAADVLFSGDVIGQATELSAPTGNVHHLGFAVVLGSPAGTYTFRLTAKDLAGNPTAVAITTQFSVPAAPSATLTVDTANITVGGSAHLTTTFANGSGIISANPADATLPGTLTTGQQVTVSPTVTTLYTLTVTNAAGAIATSIATVFVGQNVLATLVAPGPSTPGQSVNLTANVGANATQAFVVPGNLSVIADGANHPVVVSPDVTTTFTLVATNSAGQEFRATATVVVTQPALAGFAGPDVLTTGTAPTFTVQFTPVTASTTVSPGCTGGTVTGTSPASRTFTCPSITTNTTYTAAVALGTASVQATIAVQVAPLPTATLVASATEAAKGSTITLTPTFSGASSYIADDAGVHIVDNPTSAVPTAPITVSRTNTYTLVALNAAGASVTNSVTVTALNTIAQTGNTTATRFGATATLLNTGRVLIAGGGSTAGGNGTNSAGIYNPITRTYSATGNLGTARRDHTAHMLSDGTVLLVGGFDGSGAPLRSLETYNPGAGTFSPITITGGTGGGMVNPRALHTSTVLPNGTLLVAGGCGTAACDITVPDARATAEIIDLVAGSTSATTTPMNAPHVGATGTLLGSGKVLIAGGATSAGGNGTDFAEIFSAGTFSCPGTTCAVGRTPMGTARNGHGALLLPNGQVALFGGKTNAGTMTATIELFDPAGTGTFATNAASLGTGRWLLQATQLAGAGRILISGGFTTGTTIASTVLNLFDVSGTTLTAVTGIDVLTTARGGHTATLLFGGTALMSGGTSGSASGELFSSAQ